MGISGVGRSCWLCCLDQKSSIPILWVVPSGRAVLRHIRCDICRCFGNSKYRPAEGVKSLLVIPVWIGGSPGGAHRTRKAIYDPPDLGRRITSLLFCPVLFRFEFCCFWQSQLSGRYRRHCRNTTPDLGGIHCGNAPGAASPVCSSAVVRRLVIPIELTCLDPQCCSGSPCICRYPSTSPHAVAVRIPFDLVFCFDGGGESFSRKRDVLFGHRESALQRARRCKSRYFCVPDLALGRNPFCRETSPLVRQRIWNE